MCSMVIIILLLMKPAVAGRDKATPSQTSAAPPAHIYPSTSFLLPCSPPCPWLRVSCP